MAKKKQQGNGSGTVYPRKNKDGKITSYLGAYYGPDGKRRTVSAKTKTECREKLRAAMSDADKGLVYDAGTVTVAAYLRSWLETIEGTVADNTYQGYARMVNNHLVPTIGKNLLKSLTPNHVRNLYRSKSDNGLSARTVQYIHVTLHRALKQTVYDGLIPRNVTEGVRPPKLEQKEAEYLTREQARKLLEAARGNRLEALYIVALHTGMREGELLGLKWENWVTKDKLSVRGTKSRSSRRPVRLSQTAQGALRTHRKHRLEERVAASDYEDPGFVFSTQSGKKMDRHNLWRQFQRLLKKADLPPVPFHSLRHTCATLLFHEGKSDWHVQKLFGHSSSKITRDTYTHHIEGHDGGLADAMDELLG